MHYSRILEKLDVFNLSLSVLGLNPDSVRDVMATTGAVICGDVAIDHVMYMTHNTMPNEYETLDFVVYGGIGESPDVDDADIIYETLVRQQLFYRNVFDAFNTLALSARYTFVRTRDGYPDSRTVIWKRNTQTLTLTFSSKPIATRMKHTSIGLAAGYIYKDMTGGLMVRHIHIEDVQRKRIAWVHPDLTHTVEQQDSMKYYASRYGIIPDGPLVYKYIVSTFMKEYDTLSETGTLYLVGNRAELTAPIIQRRICGIPNMHVKYVFTDELPTHVMPELEWGGEIMSSSQSTIMYESE